MRDADIYRQQGFGQKIGRGERPALLVVDFVNGFLDPAVFGGGNIVEAAERTKPLLEAARKAGLPIVFTRIVYAEDGSDAGVWCEKAPRLKTLTESSAASQVVDFLAPRTGELVVRKTQASAFFATDLASYLTYRGVDSVIIVGCTTSGCVRATVVDAISHNFRPVVVAECVGDRAQGPHEANLFDIGQKYADLVDLDEAMKRLSVE
ncbi:MAG: isochorismatase family protein [Propylenella sp.]